MDCKEINKMIPGFLNQELSNRELREFMDHISSCRECKEELSIQFLIQEGMASLEDGTTFDLQHGLDRLLEDATRKMRMRRWLHWFVYGVEIVAIITIITIIVLIMAL